MAYSSKFRFISLLGIFAVVGALFVPALPKSIHAQDPAPQKIESDAVQVSQVGTWLSQSSPNASGGSYLYNSGEAVLTLNFAGPSLEVIYVSGPSLGTLAIEVDGTVLRTVITTAENTAYGQVAKIDYLTDEPHELKVYAQSGGTIAIDAFLAEAFTLVKNEPASTTRTVANWAEGRNLPCHAAALIEHIGSEYWQYAISDDGRYVGSLRHHPPHAEIWLYDRQTCADTLLYSHFLGQDDEVGYRSVGAFSMSGSVQYFSFRVNYTTYYPSPYGSSSTQIIYDRARNQFDIVNEASGSPYFFGTTYEGDFSADGQIWVLGRGPLAIRNQTTRAIRYLEVAGNNLPIRFSGNPAISANGRHITFTSQLANSVPDDTNGAYDIFVYDWFTEQIRRVSITSAGAQVQGDSLAPEISGDGRYVIFTSQASDLVPDDTNGVADLFLHDTQTGTTTRISVGSNGEQTHDGDFGETDITADGRYITFVSGAAFWTPNDTNGVDDIFVYDQQTATFTLMSSPGNGTQANEDSYAPSFADTTHEVAFYSSADTLVPNILQGLFVTAIRTTGDKLALFRADLNAVGLVGNLSDPPPSSSYMIVTMPPPATGQWVMGDWDGDGDKTPGVYGDNGVFYYANETNETATWSAVWVGLLNRPPVAGRFAGAVNHDCIGVVDNAEFPPYGTAFALYFTCDLTPATAPSLAFQWLSVILPDSAGFSGPHQFSAGDFNNDGVDSIAIRRGDFIAFTNVPPTTLLSDFSLAQYWGTPPTTGGNEGIFLTGDFDNATGDSFGVFYQNGHFYYRNSTEWNPAGYELQRVGQPLGTPVQATSWR